MKRVLSMCLAVLMAVYLLPATATRAASESVAITVAADRESAVPGDTVKFTVTLGAVEHLGGLDFKLVIPEGLTIDYAVVRLHDGNVVLRLVYALENVPAGTYTLRASKAGHVMRGSAQSPR